MDDAFPSAVGALPETELRAFVLQWGRSAPSDFRDALVAHTVRVVPSFKPVHEDFNLVCDAEALVAAAKHRDLAPHEVDHILQRAGRALVAGDVATARRAYEAVLGPLSRADIALPGVDEFPDEVLSVCMRDVCASFLVATYESAPADGRVEAVAAVAEIVDDLQHLDKPLQMMEQAAVRPLEGFDAFAAQWLGRVRTRPLSRNEWAARTALEEAIERTEGTAGLRRQARAEKSAEAYRAWCRALRQQQRWQELIEALQEASATISSSFELASFHDEAARLQEKVGHPDKIEAHLQAAYDAQPNLDRFLAVMDHGRPSAEQLRDRARRLLPSCDSDALRGLILLLTGDHAAAIQVLTDATGHDLFWALSPNALVFPPLVLLVGGAPPPSSVRASLVRRIGGIASLLERCDYEAKVPTQPALDALRAAAWKCVETVIASRHRSRYRDGALLAVCVAELQAAIGDRAGAFAWLEQVRNETRYWPRFQREVAGLRAAAVPALLG